MLTTHFSIGNSCLVPGYFHGWYYTMRDPRNTMRFITNLKNDIPPYHSPAVLRQSEQELAEILSFDFA